jgi:hypothetical protein
MTFIEQVRTSKFEHVANVLSSTPLEVPEDIVTDEAESM